MEQEIVLLSVKNEKEYIVKCKWSSLKWPPQPWLCPLGSACPPRPSCVKKLALIWNWDRDGIYVQWCVYDK